MDYLKRKIEDLEHVTLEMKNEKLALQEQIKDLSEKLEKFHEN